MSQALSTATSPNELIDALLAALADAAPAPDALLPDTGVGLARERLLSPRFVRMPDPERLELALYGTRCATVLVTEVLAGGRRHTHVVERTVDAAGRWAAPVRHELPVWG